MATNAPTTEEAARAVGDFFGLPPMASADLGDLEITAAIVVLILLLA